MKERFDLKTGARWIYFQREKQLVQFRNHRIAQVTLWEYQE